MNSLPRVRGLPHRVTWQYVYHNHQDAKTGSLDCRTCVVLLEGLALSTDRLVKRGCRKSLLDALRKLALPDIQSQTRPQNIGSELKSPKNEVRDTNVYRCG
eukprot:1185120-Prorocentrum_minimum.AAC.4